MGAILEIHLVVAFLLVLCALVFSWNALGRRVVNAVAALQFLVGIALAGVLGASHAAMPNNLWLHVLSAILVLAAYGLAMRYGKRAGGSRTAIALSVLGLILVFFTFYLGLRMAGLIGQAPSEGGHLVVYYTKVDGKALGTWTISTRGEMPGESAAEHLKNTALVGAVQAVAGPPADVQAIRFPSGTRVTDVSVNGSVATVDLSKEVAAQSGGSFSENGEFKGLVYTLTGIPPIDAVQVTVAGHKLETLPGGHLELDEPLHRSDW